MSNLTRFPGSRERETKPADGSSAVIAKFPYNVSGRAQSRKPRRSKNGTPEERAAKLAAGIPFEAPRRRPVRELNGKDWDELLRVIGPEHRESFVADAWKLVNRYWRKL
ncbi:hypothetical protein JQ615_36400 [Bradyrhizobium jicamae]|uniref:Uncharacterized protein n=1 Tax=Bradyrhizobium jicamae TaxID=280332 RepID=A0ABS5FVJ2_9BRAD|nr:hypothetical protein [Bradyrhizobium jicamae]MBR0800857.1 hypothetical protein [Bradyrhizobium jicamae]